LNILIVHNYYKLPGGEDTVVQSEKNLLESRGHKVVLYTRSNKELDELGILGKLLLPINTVFSMKTYREVKAIIKREKIDVLHVHNTLSLLSPSVYYAGFKCKIPVVQTVHNFRLLCPGATFYRDGKICEDCLHKGLGCAVKHRCYRGSLMNTLASVVTLKVHRFLGTYRKLNYICLTEFNKSKILQVPGVKESQIFIKPNFTTQSVDYDDSITRDGYLYVGRLEKIKGIDVLLKAWKILGDKAPKLTICGSGDLEDKCRKYIKKNGLSSVDLLGQTPNEVVKDLMQHAKALVYPTQVYETFGLTVIEAFSMHTPVVVGDMGNAGSLVDNKITGLKYKHDNPESLAKEILVFESMDFGQLGKNAYKKYREKYTEEANYQLLMDIYKRCMIQ